MLLLACSLWITVSAVDIQLGQPLPDETDSKSRPIKRLPIFESLTKSDNEESEDLPMSPENEYSAPESGDAETVNVVLSRLLVDFHVPETVEFGRSLVAVRASQNEGQFRDLIVFRSLLLMFTNSKDSKALLPWQQYLAESIRNQSASVINLCVEYSQNFKCEEGHLTFINVDGKGSLDHLNLLMIPNAVTVLSAQRCKLKTISPWSDLKGKSLECLRLKDNADLKLNLHGLAEESNHLSLKRLVISKVLVWKYFGLQTHDSMDHISFRITEWMKETRLESIKVTNSHNVWTKRKTLSFRRDGTWAS